MTGRTVIPGLIDLHVHLGSPDLARGEKVGPTRIPGIIYDSVRYVPGARRALLDHGVTTVRALGDENQWILEARQLLRDGEIEGPRVLTSGPLFSTRGGHPVATFGVEPTSDAVRLPTTPAQARHDVAALLRGSGNHDGVDLIKVVQERGGPRKKLEPLSPDVLAAIVAEAHTHGARVTAHWGTAEDLADLRRRVAEFHQAGRPGARRGRPGIRGAGQGRRPRGPRRRPVPRHRDRAARRPGGPRGQTRRGPPVRHP